MKPKPACLGSRYAEQFRDESVATAYRHRPPYARQVFEKLGSLQPGGPGRVVDLGCGTGDVAIGLVPFVTHIDAVDPSAAMLTRARSRLGDSAKIEWHRTTAEDFRWTGPYSLVVAGSSLHWMDLQAVTRGVAQSLAPDAYLAIVDRSRLLPPGLRQGLSEVIPRYSTNTDYEPYDAVALVAERELFREVGRAEFVMPHAPTLPSFVESFHSQNGFSRDRMSDAAASGFEQEVRSLTAPFLENGRLRTEIRTRLVWGHPADT